MPKQERDCCTLEERCLLHAYAHIILCIMWTSSSIQLKREDGIVKNHILYLSIHSTQDIRVCVGFFWCTPNLEYTPSSTI